MLSNPILKTALSRSSYPALWSRLLVVFIACGFGQLSYAGTISWSGSVTESTEDGTGPAVNNPSLNGIFDFQAYSVTLSFTGSIATPGTYNNLTGATLTFTDASASATEAGFASVFLTIAANGGFDDFSVLGCLTAGSGCAFGNQLDSTFRIPAAGLNSSQNVTATGLDQPHPLDLLEDDGTTEIQGIITVYSYTGSSPAPEPSSLGLSCLAAMVAAGQALKRGMSTTEFTKEKKR
jgi:hypothetical protein